MRLVWTKKAKVSVLVMVFFGFLLYGLLHWISPDVKQAYFPEFLTGEQIGFNRDIRPILNNKCIVCHGGVKQSGGFSLLFPEAALSPNESGEPAIVPGKPQQSEM